MRTDQICFASTPVPGLRGYVYYCTRPLDHDGDHRNLNIGYWKEPMPTYSDPPTPRGTSERPAAPPTGRVPAVMNAACTAAANLKGEHIRCDWPTNEEGEHPGWAHANTEHELLWQGVL